MLHIHKHGQHKPFHYYRGSPPDIQKDPAGWFNFTDHDRDGYIHQEEVIISICATLHPTSSQRLPIRRHIQEDWYKFDKDHKMKLSKEEFLHCGIVPYIISLEERWNKTYKGIMPPVHENANRRRASIGHPPSLSKAPRQWFEHYDTDHNQTLSQAEVIHGLYETLKPETEDEKKVIRETVRKSWSTFDVNNYGTINKWEFLSKGGYIDYLMMLEHDWNKSKDYRTTKHMMNIQVLGSRRHSYQQPPSINANLSKWFDHFDIDYSGYLTQSELISGLFVTLNANTKTQRRAIREHVVSEWDSRQELKEKDVIQKKDFLKMTNGLGQNLAAYTQSWDSSSFLKDEEDAEDKGNSLVEIKVNIPEGGKPGDIMKVSSPVSHEVVILMIPDKIKWGGGEGEPFYFTVKFYSHH